MKNSIKKIFDFLKNNLIYFFAAILILFLVFATFKFKNKVEIISKKEANIFKQLSQKNKEYKKITEENFSRIFMEKTLPIFFKNVSKEGNNIKINPDILKEENISKITDEIIKDWEEKVIEDFKKDYELAKSNLKIVSSTKENSINFARNLDSFYKKISDFLKKDPEYIAYNLNELDNYFNDFIKIEVPETAKKDYFYALKRLIVFKNILKYYYEGAKDPMKMLVSIGLIKVMDDKKIDEIFNQF